MNKKQSTVLRDLLARKQILYRPTVANALQAKMAEALGFEAISISGGLTSANILGLPDAGYITRTEMIDNIRNISNTVNIPVMADCETGYGNAISVRYTTQMVIQAGAAGLFLEDQVSPKRCGFVKGKEIISVEEAVGKLRAAVDVRNEMDHDFVIMARTDGRTAVGGSLEEAIKRGKAYKEEGGADIVYMEALQSVEEIKQTRAAINGPLACGCQAIQPHPTLQELQDLGLCMTLGIMVARVGDMAVWNMLSEMKQKGLEPYIEWDSETRDHPLGGFKFWDLLGFGKICEWEQKYLPKEQLAKYDKSEGLFDPKSAKR